MVGESVGSELPPYNLVERTRYHTAGNITTDTLYSIHFNVIVIDRLTLVFSRHANSLLLQ